MLFGVLLWAGVFLIVLLLKANADNILPYKDFFWWHCMTYGITGKPTVLLHKYSTKAKGVR